MKAIPSSARKTDYTEFYLIMLNSKDKLSFLWINLSITMIIRVRTLPSPGRWQTFFHVT